MGFWFWVAGGGMALAILFIGYACSAPAESAHGCLRCAQEKKRDRGSVRKSGDAA